MLPIQPGLKVERPPRMRTAELIKLRYLVDSLHATSSRPREIMQLKCLIFTNAAPKPQFLIHSGHVNFEIQNPKCTSILGLKTKSTISEITSRASGVREKRVETPAVSSILSLNPRGPQRTNLSEIYEALYKYMRYVRHITFEVF